MVENYSEITTFYFVFFFLLGKGETVEKKNKIKRK